MEIDKEALIKSKEIFLDLQNELNEIYDNIPSGKCNGCAKCCMEAVGAFYVEFLNIYFYLKDKNLLGKYMDKIENHYMDELIKKDYCPFLLSDKTCLIYPVRPLVCRLFGHSSKEVHESNYENIYQMNKEADAYLFDVYNIHLPEEVLNQKIEYCDDFEIAKAVTEDKKNNMVDALFMMDSKFLMADLIPEDAINMSITNWFVYLKYDEETASELRIKNLLNHNE